jgi:hypothetical protein
MVLMLRKDIKTGTVYAYYSSRHGAPEPCVFLSPGLWTTDSAKADESIGGWCAPAPEGAKAHWGHYMRTGYLVARRWYASRITGEELIPLLLNLTLKDLADANWDHRIGEHIHVEMLAQLGTVNGIYWETAAAHEAREREIRERREQREARTRDQRRRGEAVVAVLAEHGIRGSYRPGYVEISLIPAERLAALLTERRSHA